MRRTADVASLVTRASEWLSMQKRAPKLAVVPSVTVPMHVYAEQLRALTCARNALKTASAEIERLVRLDSTQWEHLTDARGSRDAAHTALLSCLEDLLRQFEQQQQQALTHPIFVVEAENVMERLLADANQLAQVPSGKLIFPLVFFSTLNSNCHFHSYIHINTTAGWYVFFFERGGFCKGATEICTKQTTTVIIGAMGYTFSSRTFIYKVVSYYRHIRIRY